jgi:uncharacterized protein YodC (DUF2158 family)
MAEQMRRGTFHALELVLVPRPRNPVVHVSGGSPIMSMESTEDGMALCSWTDDEGKLNRAVFPVACLYECRDM